MANEQHRTGGVLVVIPCLNEERHLEKLVLDLVASCRKLPMRIVIADGGSEDRTWQIGQELASRYSNVLLMSNPRRLQAAAINLAVEAYGNDAGFLIRMDAHAGYPPDYCQILIQEAERTNASSVVVAMKTVGGGWFERAVAAAQNSRLGNGGSAHRIAGQGGMWTDHGHHALMRVEAFRRAGGYDESFSHNEDAELDMRLRRAGFNIWLTGKTSLIYYPRSSPAALFRQYVRYGAGRARTVLKHRARPKLRQLASAGVLPAVLLALAGPLFWPAVLPLAVWMGFCLGGGIMLGIKARNTHMAAAGPVAMIMHLAWSLGFWKSMLGSRM
jgi:succinoglycan biosynthesis protein ExoA